MKLSIHAAVLALLLAQSAANGQNFANSAPSTGAPDYAAGEPQLLETLRQGSPAEKAVACKQLAIHGTKTAVPELAKLLPEPQLSSWARIALEAIPDPAAGDALLKAADSLDGKLLVGVINSIGVRRDAPATGKLAGRLNDKAADVASAAAVALGRIANPEAVQALRGSLAGAPEHTRAAVAEGCILCAEKLMADGNSAEAAKIYDEVREAEVSRQQKLEATRGSILAQGSKGIPLLLEQLRSDDEKTLQFALSTARELSGEGVNEALADELANAQPARAALLLYALVDRHDAKLTPSVLAVVKKGDKPLRLAALEAVGRLGGAENVEALLEIAIERDDEVAQAAKTALKTLRGRKVDAELTGRLRTARKGLRSAVIEAIGERRIEATAELVAALNDADPAVRQSALRALGATVRPDSLSVLISTVVEGKHADDAQVAVKALREACIRMPDREKCATQLAAALSQAPAETKLDLLEILGAMGGPKALQTIAAAAREGEADVQDAGSRLLGEWMSVDAAPVLLDMAKNLKDNKYKVRALRGCLRLARQFSMPDRERAEICQQALDVATRPEEQKLVLEILERYPSVDTLKVAAKASKAPALKAEAARVALTIAQKLGTDVAEAREILAENGLSSVKVEIIKAQYGAGSTQQDVTVVLQQYVRDLPLITLASPNYNESFKGDPSPGNPKELKIEYRINGEPGTASFPENAVIMLPMPE